MTNKFNYFTIISDDVLSIVRLQNDMIFDVWQNSLDDDNRRFVPDEVFETLEEATEVVSELIKNYETSNGPFVYAVIRNSDNTNIGYVQLVPIDRDYEIGYHIANKYTGNGYATRAVSLFLDYLKNNTDIKEIYGIALADNVASRRVLEKSGFNLIFEGEDLYQGQKRKIIRTMKKL